MNVLVLTPWYPHDERPAEAVFVREHAAAAATRHDVAVLHLAEAPLRGGRRAWRLEEVTDPALTDGLPTWRVVVPRELRRLMPVLPFLAALVAARRVAASHGHPDLIHAHTFLAGAPGALLAGAPGALLTRRRRVPLVVTEHWSDVGRERLRPSLGALARAAYRGADAVVAVSRRLADTLDERGARPRRTVVVPNPVDTARFRPADPLPERPPAHHELLFVGHLTAEDDKGFGVLIDALARAHRRGRDDWHLTVVGDGPARDRHERRARDAGLGDRVTFTGTLPHDDVAEQMRRADLLVHPSRHETFALVVAEALCCGTPVVATDVGAAGELIAAARAGRLLDAPVDPDTLAEAVTAALDEPTDRLAVAAATASHVGREVVAAQLDHLYRELTASGIRQPRPRRRRSP